MVNVKDLPLNVRWFMFKRKLVCFIGFAWCDWCEMLCFRPTQNHTGYDEYICRHCVDDAQSCEVCQGLVHPDYSKDMPEGWYCEDCWDSVYG